MEIAWADFKSIPLGYISPTGVVSPEYYEPKGNQWLRNYYGGLLSMALHKQVGLASLMEKNMVCMGGYRIFLLI
ncbi:MAG: DUF4432 family protein [Actinomycetota bacterium]|nr:DUF4432 family protein [Actinomycetota bacterium]